MDMDVPGRSIYVGLPQTESIENKVTADKVWIYFQKKEVSNCDVELVSIKAPEGAGDKVWMEVVFAELSGVEHVLAIAEHKLVVEGRVIPLEVRADLPPDIQPSDSRSSDDGAESFVVISEDDVDKEALKDEGPTTEASPSASKGQSTSPIDVSTTRLGGKNAASFHADAGSPETTEVPHGAPSQHHVFIPATVSAEQSAMDTNLQGDNSASVPHGPPSQLYEPDPGPVCAQQSAMDTNLQGDNSASVPHGPPSMHHALIPAPVSAEQSAMDTNLQGDNSASVPHGPPSMHHAPDPAPVSAEQPAMDTNLQGDNSAFVAHGPPSVHYAPNPAPVSLQQSALGTNLQGDSPEFLRPQDPPPSGSAQQSANDTNLQEDNSDDNFEDAIDEDLYSPNGSENPKAEFQNPKKKMKFEPPQDTDDVDMYGKGDEQQNQGSSQQQMTASGDGLNQQQVESGKHLVDGGGWTHKGRGWTHKGRGKPQQMGAAAQDHVTRQDQQQVESGNHQLYGGDGTQKGREKPQQMGAAAQGHVTRQDEDHNQQEMTASGKGLNQQPVQSGNHQLYGSDGTQKGRGKPQQRAAAAQDHVTRQDQQQVESGNHQLYGGDGTQKGRGKPQQMGAAAQDHVTSQNQQQVESGNHQSYGGDGSHKGRGKPQQMGAAAHDHVTRQDQQQVESGNHQLYGGDGTQKGRGKPQQMGAAAQDHVTSQNQQQVESGNHQSYGADGSHKGRGKPQQMGAAAHDHVTRQDQQQVESGNHQSYGGDGSHKGRGKPPQIGAAAQGHMTRQDQDHHQQEMTAPGKGLNQQQVESGNHQLDGGHGSQKGREKPQPRGAAVEDHMTRQDQDNHQGPQNTAKSSGPQTAKKKQKKRKNKKGKSEITEESQTAEARGPPEAPSKQEETMPEEDSPAEEQEEKEEEKEEEEQFVEVTGFKKSSSEEMLKMHFENSRRSGGGEIKTWEHDPKNGVIRMSFENPSIASAVTAKQQKVGGETLKVKKIVKKKPRPRPVKKRCLFLSGIPDGCNSEHLGLFIENRSGMDEPRMQYGEVPGTALCTFSEDIQDLEKVMKKISSKSLSGGCLTAEKVQESDCILVEGVAAKANLEMIELYFDNKKKSGGTGVREVQQGPTDTQAIVYFEDWKVIADVLSKRGPHKVAGTELLVEEYHEGLGRLSLLDVPTPHVPKPVTVQVPEPIMEFIFGKGQHTKKTLIQKLRDVKAILKWPDAGDKTRARLEPLLEDGQRQSNWLKWSETAPKVLTDFLNRCKSSRIPVPVQLWKVTMDQINQLGRRSFSIQPDASTHLVTLVGEQQDVDKGHTDIDKIIKDLIAKAQFEAQQTKEDITLKEELSQPFIICGIKDKLEQNFPKLKITVISLQDRTKLVFEGSRKIVQEAELSMRRQLDNLDKMELKMGCNKVKFVLNVTDKIHEILGSQGIRAACKASDDIKVIIAGATKKDATDAKAYLSREIEEDVIPIKGQATMDVLQNQNGQKLLNGINKQKFVMVAISNKGGNCVQLAGFKTYLGETKQRIIDFLKHNVIVKKIVPANKNRILLITRFHGSDLLNVQKQNSKNRVQIQPVKSGRNKGFAIQGNEEGSEAASQAIAALIGRIKEQPYPVSKTGMAQLFREDKGKKFLEDLETRCQCVIRENVQEDSDDEAEVEGAGTAVRSVVPTKVLCRIVLPNGFTLKVCRGDLTRQKVDCIVNAANVDLKHVGGLAAAIVEAGGNGIQTESEQIIRSKRRPLHVGEPVHTSSGNLPCKKIIHVAGPRWPFKGARRMPTEDDQTHEEHLLNDGVIACLKLANKLKMQSIAIPAISTGVYGFPVDLAAKQIINAVADFCWNMPNPTLTEIHFTNIEQQTSDVFKKAVMDQFSRFQEEEDGTDVDKGSRGASWGPPIDDDDEPQFVPASTPAPAPAPRFTSSGQNILTTMEGINITLKKGSITSETVDVIVNTAGSDMQLSNGAVSKAILQAAGQALQVECSTVTAARGNIPAGEFIQSGPAALTCKKIYHCVCVSYNPATSEQFLKKLVLSLMEEAEQKEMLSIAIPALGTGNLNYPADVTARVMYEAVLEFSSQHPNGVLKDVRFVVYDKDTKTIQGFESEIQRLLTPGTPAGAAGFPLVGRKLKKPGSSSAPTDRQRYSAIQRGDTGMLQTKIGSVCLQVAQGDLVKEPTDAIVNSVGPKMDLNGPVSKAILAKGGKTIAQECDFSHKKDPKKLVHVTTAGRLQSSCIFHVLTPRTAEEIKTIVFKTLTEAEKIKMKSVSFPALGTGQAGQAVADCASAIMTAVGEFAVRKKPRHLHLIRLVIFQAAMVTGFQDALKSVVGTSYKEDKGLLSKGFGYVKSAITGMVGSGGSADGSTEEESLQETIILNIYAMDMASLNKATDSINQFQREEFTSEERPDIHGLIDKMTEEHKAEIRAIEKKCNVKIKFVTKNQAKHVKVEGCTLNVKEASIKIQELFTKMQKEELEAQQTEHLFKEVQWKYSTHLGLEAYEPEANAIIEEAYKNNRPSVRLNFEDGNVTIDLQTMEEVSGARRVNVHRVDLKKAASFELPPNWIPMDKQEHLKQAPLTAGTAEYSAVETQFQKSMGSRQIQEIHRIQNRDLMMIYQARKAAMEARLDRTNVEESLFHGTDEQTCKKINQSGFNRSFCGKNATVYGNGTYFAVNADYSAQTRYAQPNANGIQHIYLTKVLVGDYIRGNQGIITPPNKPKHPDQQYDSVVDNVNQPSIYVIFHDAQAYPEYLIKFK